MSSTPNIVLVVLDTVRRDRVSAYGYDRETTPAFDRFASRATLYSDAISQAPWSIPAHASLFTGLYPNAHGATTVRPVLRARQPLPAVLSRAGYHTVAVSPNEYVRPATGFGAGFDEFYTGSRLSAPAPLVDIAGPLLNRLTSSPTVRRPLERAFNRLHHGDCQTGIVPPPSYGISDRVESILAETPEPFFLFVNLPHAHLPRSPDQTSLEQFVDADRPVDAVVRNERAHNFGEHVLDSFELKTMSQLYDADLRTMDARFASVLDVLDRNGVLSDSLVVVVSDHGEHLGEHGLIGHQHSVFEPVVSVPLAIASPEGGPRRVDSQVETRRVYHTVLDTAGVRPYPTLSLASGTGDFTVRSSFTSPMLDLDAFLSDGTIEHHPDFLGARLSFERTPNETVVEFGGEPLSVAPAERNEHGQSS